MVIADPDDGRRLRVAFFGTPDFALPTLERLVASRHSVVLAVTQPDRPRGRGQRTGPSPVKRVAIEHDIRVAQPARVRDPAFLREVETLVPDVGVVAAYGQILPTRLLQLPRLGLLNVHASLLPRYRGAAPVQRAIMAGDTRTGVTIMRVVKELDAGPTLASVTRDIGPDETSDVLEAELARLGADLMLASLDAVAAGAAREVPQEADLATYAPRLTKADGLVDWSQPAERIHSLVLGLHPWPHAFTFLGSTRFVIWRTGEPGLRLSGHQDVAGAILRAEGDDLRVATGQNGWLRILEIQAEGRRTMPIRAFLAGHAIAPGTVFRRATIP